MFYQTYAACKEAKITPPSLQRRKGAICVCMMSFAASAFHSVTAGGNGTGQRIFCPWWLWRFTLIFKLVQARDQTHLPCEFGAYLFSHSRNIWATNKKSLVMKCKIKATELTQNWSKWTLQSAIKMGFIVLWLSMSMPSKSSLTAQTMKYFPRTSRKIHRLADYQTTGTSNQLRVS